MSRDLPSMKSGTLPLGVRLAVVLLGILAALMAMPMAAGLILCIYFTLEIDFGRQSVSACLGLNLLALLGLSLCFVMMGGALWLLQHLVANHYRGDPSHAPARPKGFLSMVVEPVLDMAILHSALALLVGFFQLGHGWLGVLIWSFFWLGLGSAWFYTRRWMQRDCGP